MATIKTFRFSLDVKSENSISLPNVVAGDTGNQFIISMFDNNEPLEIEEGTRIRFIINNRDGQGAQDTAMEDNGITFEGNVITVNVFSSMVSNGLNTGCVELYTQNEEIQITSNDFTFVATNSPTEKAYAYPSLVAAEKSYQTMLQTLEQYMATLDPDSLMRYPTPKKAHYIVETDENGDVTLIHRLFITNDPSSLTGLIDGDIILSPAGR